MLSEATSGLKCAVGFKRSSTVIVGAPPVVMLITTLHAALIFLRKGSNAAGLWSGLPFLGSRACRWTIAAPASWAPMAASAISSAVIGRCGDIVGVWIAPVTAHVMMTLREDLWCVGTEDMFSRVFGLACGHRVQPGAHCATASLPQSPGVRGSFPRHRRPSAN